MESTQDPRTSSSSDNHDAATAIPNVDGAASASEPFASPSSNAAAGKADLTKRFVAMLIDSVLAYAIGFVPVIGGIIGAAYMVVRDGLDLDFMKQRSIGKHIMKLRPVHLDGQPMDLEASFRRNWMFGLGALVPLLLFIPILGWILIPFVGLAALGLGLFELYKVLTDEEGRRWGDDLARTKVVEVDE